MKALGTALFAIFLMVSPVAIVNAQTAVQPTTTSDVATKSDVFQATAELSQKMKRSTAELKADIAREAQARADAQRAAEKAVADKRDADQKAELARQAKAQADAAKTRNMIIGSPVCLFSRSSVCSFTGTERRRSRRRLSTWHQRNPPHRRIFYGTHPSPTQVKECLLKNNLKEGRFTIDLPDDNLVFEYRAVVDLEGTVTARFTGNGDEVTALRQLRKRAKELYADGAGPLKPITLKPIGIRRVS